MDNNVLYSIEAVGIRDDPPPRPPPLSPSCHLLNETTKKFVTSG